MMKRKYLAPVCAGLITLAGIGTMIKGARDVYIKDYNNYPEIKELLEIQSQRGSLEYKFFVQSEEVRVGKLFENEQSLLKEYQNQFDEIKDLREREKKLLNNTSIKLTYDRFKEEDWYKKRSANNNMLFGGLLFLSGGLYLSGKYGKNWYGF